MFKGENMKDFDVIIIGGGASGCICAIFAKNKYKNILIIDKQPKLAKKILVTGNGRCNLTNIATSSKYYNQNIDNYLKQFNVNDTLSFFNKIGLEYYFDNEGRVYPISNSAKSVVEVITNEIEKLQINYQLNSEVKEIMCRKDGFIVETDKTNFSSKKLVIATGGNSLNNIISCLGIKSKVNVPSLVSLKINSSKNLANIRLSNVKTSLIINNKNVYSELGEILFRENGISGICIFNISAILSRRHKFDGELHIDLLPNYTEEEIYNKLLNRKKINSPLNKFFDGMFARQIGYEILNRAKIDENRLSNKLTNDEIKSFANIIKNLNFKIKDCLENNQVYSGGIILSELNQNLECKKYKNLYFCGEVCDVDGMCGGYNLQWAWTSGAIIGQNI